MVPIPGQAGPVQHERDTLRGLLGGQSGLRRGGPSPFARCRDTLLRWTHNRMQTKDSRPIVQQTQQRRRGYGRGRRQMRSGRGTARPRTRTMTGCSSWKDMATRGNGDCARPKNTPSPRYSGERVGVRGQTANADILRPFLPPGSTWTSRSEFHHEVQP